SSLALASSSSVIVVCAEPSIGTDLSLVYGPIQFHWPSLADLNMAGALSGQTKLATKQTTPGTRRDSILNTSPPKNPGCPLNASSAGAEPLSLKNGSALTTNTFGDRRHFLRTAMENVLSSP